MKYCKTCNIKVESELKHCLFCHDLLKYYDNKPAKDSYPTYKPKNKVLLNILKLLIVLNIVSILTLIFIDGSMNGYNNLTYSLIVAASNLYAIIVFVLIYIHKKLVTKILAGSLVSILFVLSIGYLVNDYIWAINYVLPFTMIGNLITISLFLIFNRKKWIDYVTTLFVVSILGVAAILLVIFGVTTVHWPMVGLSATSFAIILSLLLFSPKELKEDFKRRFHL